jgi:peptidoglycan/xylan/chitin deacetylase (PgdA/CDA1 family)
MIALMYHDIVSPRAEDASGFPGRDAARYKVTTEGFDAHLRVIAELTLAALPAPPALPASPALLITFDDGGASGVAAADALERHGLRGCFLVTTNYIGTRGFLDEPAIRELDRRGHTIGSHSCSHPLRMGHCSWEQLLDEWTRSREVISNILGKAVTTASVPGGDYAPSVADAAAQAGYTRLFTSEPTDRPRRISGIELIGRFTICRWTSVSTLRSLVAGNWQPRARQALTWQVRKIGKRVAGDSYLRLRRILLRHGDEVQWGDQGGNGGGGGNGFTRNNGETKVTFP